MKIFCILIQISFVTRSYAIKQVDFPIRQQLTCSQLVKLGYIANETLTVVVSKPVLLDQLLQLTVLILKLFI